MSLVFHLCKRESSDEWIRRRWDEEYDYNKYYKTNIKRNLSEHKTKLRERFWKEKFMINERLIMNVITTSMQEEGSRS
jgi:hypothetical protein